MFGDGVDVPRFGEVFVDSLGQVSLRRRRFPYFASQWGVWFDSRFPRGQENTIRLYFSLPKRNPGYMVLSYVHSGPKTTLKTLSLGMRAISELARNANARAIVCHASNRRISDRIMEHFGYVRHAPRLKGNHYIKRI